MATIDEEFLCFDSGSLNRYRLEERLFLGRATRIAPHANPEMILAALYNERDEECGSLAMHPTQDLVEVHTSYEKHTRTRVVTPSLARIVVSLPVVLRPECQNPGAPTKDDWVHQQPIVVTQEGDFSSYLSAVRSYIRQVQDGKQVDVILPDLLQIKK